MQAELAAIDLDTHAERDRCRGGDALATEEACQPFDLENGPLFRAKLVRLSREEAVLLLTMHHIVSDGWSISVLYKELKQLYAAFRDYRALASCRIAASIRRLCNVAATQRRRRTA